MFALCLPVGVGEADLALLERVIKRRRLLRRGEVVFRQGERFHSVYAVKSGSLKTYVPVDGAGAQVTGFHLPGELLALDAVGAGCYQYTASALETASLCEVPFDRLEELGMLVPNVQRQMLRVMSGQIRQDLLMQVLHCKKTAEARLAAFLLDLSARFARRGFAAAEFGLSMSRGDIGNYLGLAKETVIRMLRRFEDRGLVSMARKRLRIRDLYGLERLAGMRAGELRLFETARPGATAASAARSPRRRT
ncbi:MAG: fumarate/nitrate reduction transcriptional regulator Fnr [Pseudomonadota bacterium]